MNRQQKEAVIKAFKAELTESNAAFLVKYRGLNVSQLQSLRTDLRQAGGRLKVTKARLMKIAAAEIDGIDGFKEDFKDQVGLVFAKEEVPSVAKKLVDFSKEKPHDCLELPGKIKKTEIEDHLRVNMSKLISLLGISKMAG